MPGRSTQVIHRIPRLDCERPQLLSPGPSRRKCWRLQAGCAHFDGESCLASNVLLLQDLLPHERHVRSQHLKGMGQHVGSVKNSNSQFVTACSLLQDGGRAEVRLSIAPNPSHLEAVGPVVLGLVRAEQARRAARHKRRAAEASQRRPDGGEGTHPIRRTPHLLGQAGNSDQRPEITMTV